MILLRNNMSNVKFSQLPDLGTITANTIVPVVAANVNYTVTAANLQTYVNTSAGNISGGNLLTGGVVSATGNITGNYILGNGSQLTGLPALYGNANVVSLLAAFGSNTISTTGTVSAGNVTGGNILTGGVVSATANITGGNINTAGVITATGNITGNYFLGNGSQLTGLPVQYGNANVSNFLANGFGSNTISTTGNITAGYFAGNGSLLTGITTSVVSNLIVGGNNFANTVAGNGRMWINGGNSVAGGNIDGLANNLLYISAGGATGPRMVMDPASSGNINIIPGNTSGYLTLSASGTYLINGAYYGSNISLNAKISTNGGGNANLAGFNQPLNPRSTSSATGTEGDIVWDTNYIYVCTATNTWKRAALSSY